MKQVFGLLFMLAIVGCAARSSDDTVRPQANPNRIDWASIPSEYNPHIQEVNLNIANAEKITLNVMGFVDDVEIQYVSNMAANSGKLLIYKVMKDGGFSDSTTVDRSTGKTVDIQTTGSYSCSIKKTNGRISYLKGGCYLRLSLILPMNVQVEVYNVNQLISPRYYAMSYDDLLKRVDRASFADQKLKEIDSYLASHQEVGKRPYMSSLEFKKIIHQFTFTSDKMKAFTRLQSAVYDREYLRALIDDEFTFSSDREEARRIAGV